MKLQVDINCDLGESYGAFRVGNDEEIMPHVTSANIACGLHAGDPLTMMRTVDLAKKHHVAIGAHPGYPDVLGFGRREMKLSLEEVEDYVIYQVSALQGFVKAANMRLQHVKPHGALYNTAARDEQTSNGIVRAVKALSPNITVFAPPKSMLAKVASDAGLRVACEAFADRAYNPDGSLVTRRQPNAIIHEPKKVVERAIALVKEGTVRAVDGRIVYLGKVHTICVHGDTPNAAELAKTMKKGLTKASIEVKPVGSFI